MAGVQSPQGPSVPRSRVTGLPSLCMPRSSVRRPEVSLRHCRQTGVAGRVAHLAPLGQAAHLRGTGDQTSRVSCRAPKTQNSQCRSALAGRCGPSAPPPCSRTRAVSSLSLCVCTQRFSVSITGMLQGFVLHHPGGSSGRFLLRGSLGPGYRTPPKHQTSGCRSLVPEVLENHKTPGQEGVGLRGCEHSPPPPRCPLGL